VDLLDHLAVAAAAALTTQRLPLLQSEYVLQQRGGPPRLRVRLAPPDSLLSDQHAHRTLWTVRMSLAQIPLSAEHINAFAFCEKFR